ncbi:MAG: hypothetical protein IJX88_03045 [Clostridia bacterium]|nr:hypothetical protein [Clostridia bacterium]
MENQTTLKTEPTKECVYLPLKDAEEYRAYKIQKKRDEINAAFACSKYSLCGGEDAFKLSERAVRLRQSAALLPLTKLSLVGGYLGKYGIKTDCAVGGTGETLLAVKVYETRLAMRGKASGISVAVTPSLVNSGRFAEIKRELKKLKRIAGKTRFTVRVSGVHAPSALSRVARIACEIKADCFSAPYHSGCERLRLDLTGGCKLEIVGVNDWREFRRLRGLGVSQIVTDKAWEMREQWLRAEDKAEEEEPQKKEELQNTEKTTTEEKRPVLKKAYNPETDYKCELVGDKLKFL